jgi:hypothetical protein
MITLERYFENPFDDPHISAEEIRLFAEDHLGKLTAQNTTGPLTGTLTTMIASTQSAFDGFDTSLSTRADQIGTQIGQTATKNDVMRLFKTTIRQRQGRVVDKLGEDTPAYKEVFPGGLMYYTRATMQTVAQRLDYAVDKFTKYQAQLGADLVTEFTNLRTSFKNARTSQLTTKGTVSDARGDVKTTRTALGLQLLDNLLTLAKQFKGQPSRAAEFFNQSLLEDPQQGNGGVTPPTPPGPPTP